jgi:uncharacterized protein YyaL (SSP411 family)
MIIPGGNEDSIPFLEDKPRKEDTLFYVCEGSTCQEPLKGSEEVLELVG